MLDRTVPHVAGRWAALAGALALYGLRVWLAQGWYIVTYGLGISLLNLFLQFITPQVDPDADGGAPLLPIAGGDEFRPFTRKLPEFKFWCVLRGRGWGVGRGGTRSVSRRVCLLLTPPTPLSPPPPPLQARGDARGGHRLCAHPDAADGRARVLAYPDVLLHGAVWRQHEEPGALRVVVVVGAGGVGGRVLLCWAQ